VENHGVDPDVEVEVTPKDWMSGHDRQLEKAVALVMNQLKEHPLPVAKLPAFPNYHTTAPAEGMPAAAGNGAAGKRRK
jgi:tricorn protease